MNNEMMIAVLKVHAAAVGQLFAVMAVSAAAVYIGWKFVTWFNVFRSIKTAKLNWKPNVGEPILYGGKFVEVLDVLDFGRELGETGDPEYVVVYRAYRR